MAKRIIKTNANSELNNLERKAGEQAALVARIVKFVHRQFRGSDTVSQFKTTWSAQHTQKRAQHSFTFQAHTGSVFPSGNEVIIWYRLTLVFKVSYLNRDFDVHHCVVEIFNKKEPWLEGLQKLMDEEARNTPIGGATTQAERMRAKKKDEEFRLICARELAKRLKAL